MSEDVYHMYVYKVVVRYHDNLRYFAWYDALAAPIFCRFSWILVLMLLLVFAFKLLAVCKALL